jgi:RNA polymerase sigma factor (sigma-70 family)
MPGRAEISATDEALVAGCLRGEQSAWNVLVDRYSALIYSIPLKYGLSEHDAADVFQTVCVTLLEKMASIRDPRGLPAWVMTTTTRQCWAVLRQHNREAARGTSQRSVELEPADPDPLPDEEVLALERQHLVRAALAQLPANCRVLLEALFSDAAQGTSYQQLAVTLGVPPNSVGPTRARCLGKLKRMLDDAGFQAR